MGGQLTKALDRLGTPAAHDGAGDRASSRSRVVVYLVMSAGPAAYTPAFTNLDPKTAGELQATLAGAGIDAQLANGGTRAQGAGLAGRRGARRRRAVRTSPSTAAVGWALFDKSDMSATDTETQVKFQRAHGGRAQAHDRVDRRRPQRHRQPGAAARHRLHRTTRSSRTASVLVDTGSGTARPTRPSAASSASSPPASPASRRRTSPSPTSRASSSPRPVPASATPRPTGSRPRPRWNRNMAAKAQAAARPHPRARQGDRDRHGEPQPRRELEDGADVRHVASATCRPRPRPRSCGRPTRPAAARPARRPTSPGGAAGRSRREAKSNYDHTQGRPSTAAIPTTQETITVAPGDPERIAISLSVAARRAQQRGRRRVRREEQDAAGRPGEGRRGHDAARQRREADRRLARRSRRRRLVHVGPGREVRRPQGVAREGRRGRLRQRGRRRRGRRPARHGDGLRQAGGRRHRLPRSSSSSCAAR